MINILIFAGLSDKKLVSKIEPITKLSNIGNVYIIRKNNLIYNKIKCYYPKLKIFKTPILFEIYRVYISLFLILKFKIDVIMGIQMTYHGMISFILSKLFKKKYIFNLIESFDFTYKSKIYQKVIKYSDIIITRGRTVIPLMNKFFKKNLKAIEVPNFYFFRTPTNRKKVKSIKTIIYCGSFTKSKRVDILIESINILKIKYNKFNFKLKLFGDGVFKQKMIEKANEYNLKNIEFYDYIKNIDNEIINSDISIMTSEFEGLPMFLIESLGYGIPVIMPNISNIPDLAIHNYNALLVEPLDVNGFADAIYRMLTDEEFYKKLKAGAEKFREEHEYEFSLENITNIWNNIFKQLGLIKDTNAK